jgi:hypothetical protein
MLCHVLPRRMTSPETGDLTVPVRPRWLALPTGVFAAAMLLSLGQDLVRPAALPVLAVGGILGYLALSFLLNSVKLRVLGDSLVLAHRPLPWLGRRVKVASIMALEITAEVGRNNVASWELHARLRDGGSVVLLGPPWVGLSYADLAGTAALLARLLGVPLR